MYYRYKSKYMEFGYQRIYLIRSFTWSTTSTGILLFTKLSHENSKEGKKSALHYQIKPTYRCFFAFSKFQTYGKAKRARIMPTRKTLFSAHTFVCNETFIYLAVGKTDSRFERAK